MGLDDIDEEAPPPPPGLVKTTVSPSSHTASRGMSSTQGSVAMDELFGDIGVSASAPSPPPAHPAGAASTASAGGSSCVSPMVTGAGIPFPTHPAPPAQQDAFDAFFSGPPTPSPPQQPKWGTAPVNNNTTAAAPPRTGSESPSLLDMSQPRQRCAHDFLDDFMGKAPSRGHATSPPAARSLGDMTAGQRPYVPPQALQQNMNLYEALGLKTNAPVEEVRKAYRGKALHLHPDKNTDRTPDEVAMFTLLTKAQEVLSDTEKRTEYDKQLNQSKASKMASENWLFHMNKQ